MDKKRLQLDITEEALTELDQLRESTGLPSRAEVIRQALRLLYWANIETQERDATLLIEKDGKMRQIVFPFWPVSTNRKVASAESQAVT